MSFHGSDSLQLHRPYASTLKTTNLIINLDNEDWIFDDDSQLLSHIGFGALL